MEMGLGYNLNEDSKFSTFDLLEDKEYMLRYQLVSIAKSHNFFGGVDAYMKEFARICMNDKTVGK
jgi:hypothetical protein